MWIKKYKHFPNSKEMLSSPPIPGDWPAYIMPDTFDPKGDIGWEKMNQSQIDLLKQANQSAYDAYENARITLDTTEQENSMIDSIQKTMLIYRTLLTSAPLSYTSQQANAISEWLVKVLHALKKQGLL